jgi:hypothetical protein
MNLRVALGATLAAAVLAGAALAADGLKSGPQEGDRLPLFGPLNLNGESAGQNACLI